MTDRSLEKEKGGTLQKRGALQNGGVLRGGNPGDFKLKTKLYLVGPEGNSFMGIGVLWLLQHIDDLGSIRQAAAHMNLSYAKAHRMVRDLEKQLNLSLVTSERGGDSRRGAGLTAGGRAFIQLYDSFQREVKNQAEGAFENFRKKIRKLY
jgi:molybdate transport system regulatory protein